MALCGVEAPLSVVFAFSNLSFPAKEGQHQNSLLLIRALCRSGHCVSVVALLRDPGRFDEAAFRAWVGPLFELHTWKTSANYPLLLVRHLLLGRRASRLVRTLQSVVQAQSRAICQSRRRAQARQSVLVQLEGIGLLPLAPVFADQPLVLSTTDAWSLRQRRLAQATGSKSRAAMLHLYGNLSSWAEARYLPLADAVHVVSPVDAEHLRSRLPALRAHAIPLALAAQPRAQTPDDKDDTQPPLVLFWGDIGVPHLAAGLEWLLREVRPRLRLGRPLRWSVLGRREPGAQWTRLAPDVQFVSWVDDVDTLLRSAQVVVLPDSQGTGLKNRVVQALACGVPVVGTHAAFEGFALSDGLHARICSDAGSFAAALDAVLDDVPAASAMGLRGRTQVLQTYGEAQMVQAWAALYRQVLACGSDQPPGPPA